MLSVFFYDGIYQYKMCCCISLKALEYNFVQFRIHIMFRVCVCVCGGVQCMQNEITACEINCLDMHRAQCTHINEAKRDDTDNDNFVHCVRIAKILTEPDAAEARRAHVPLKPND